MAEFFKSTKFKILIGTAVVLFSFLLRAVYTGGAAPMTSQLIGFITTPLQQVSASISNSVSGLFGKYFDAQNISEENEVLREKVRILTQQLMDYEKYKQENEQLREYLEVREEHPDFEFAEASVIGRSSMDRFYSFTIDKGSNAGIKQRDPVITAEGLVGIVSEVGLSYSKVLTILDVNTEVGAFDIVSRDIGILTGRLDLAMEDKCQLTLLPLNCEVRVGDLVYTSGYGGIYPQGLCIGEVTELSTENHGMTMFAVIKPAAEIKNVKSVMVIKSFQGQGEEMAE